MKKTLTKPTANLDATEHPYKEYESHPCWKRIERAISHLVENQDLIEQAARPYIVGYLCKTISQPTKRLTKRSAVKR